MAISLTAREIMVAAAMSKKAKLYGIPDDFEDLPQESVSAAVQDAKNSLWEKGCLTMDFDGNTTLSETVKSIISFCTGCDKYLSVVTRNHNSLPGKIIVWKLADHFLHATVNDKIYHFSFMDEKEAQKSLARLIPWSGKSRAGKTTTITQTALKKAKRCANAMDFDGAALLLRQQGADEVSSRIIANALFEKTSVFSFVAVDQTSEPAKSMQCMFSADSDGYLLIEPALEGYRSAASFEDITERKLKSRVAALLDAFLDIGGSTNEE